MKALALALLALSTMALAEVNPVGSYSQKHEIWAAFASASEEDCLANGGRWEAQDDGGCLIETEDTAEVKKVNGKLQLHVITVGSNAHTCEFEGPATMNKKNVLKSKVKAEQYDHTKNRIKKVTCIVTAKLDATGTKMSVTNNGKCQEFCGANGWLETELDKVK